MANEFTTAVQQGNSELVQALCSQGADRDPPGTPAGKWRNDHLCRAVFLGHMEVADVLIQHGANVNYVDVDNNRTTPLQRENR